MQIRYLNKASYLEYGANMLADKKKARRVITYFIGKQ